MNTNELTIGLDLGDRRHHVCVLSASGEILAEEVLPNTRECLAAYAARYLHLIRAKQGDRYQIGNNLGRINGWVGLNGIFGRCVRVEK